MNVELMLFCVWGVRVLESKRKYIGRGKLADGLHLVLLTRDLQMTRASWDVAPCVDYVLRPILSRLQLMKHGPPTQQCEENALMRERKK